MNLVALMPVRNEDWILGLSARVALQWCDTLIIGLHACTDRSEDIARELADEFPGRVMLEYQEGDWDEMQHRNDLLDAARFIEATHIALVDADEILTANLLPRIRSLVEGTPAGHILQLPLYNLRNGVHQYHANGLWGNRITSVAFPDLPELHWGGDRYHHREPMGRNLTGFRPVDQGDGGVLHFWGSSERRLKAKHALYKLTERLRWPDKDVRTIDREYSMWKNGSIGEDASKWTFKEAPTEWIPAWSEVRRHRNTHVEGEPWQEAEVRRLIAEHGRERFAGLDLFEVDA